MFKYSSVPAYSFSKSRKANKNAEIPGPGAYDADKAMQLVTKAEHTTAILRPSVSRPSSKTNPIGPGQYDPKEPISKVKGFYFPATGKPTSLKASELPGPGQYSYEDSLARLKSHQAKVVIGKAEKGMILSKDTQMLPGPGQYNVDSQRPIIDKFKSEGGYKFPGSKKGYLSMDPNIPGPGAYSVENVTGSKNAGAKSYSIPKSVSRPNSSNLTVPGPGAYAFETSSPKHGIRFGKQERKGLERNGVDPGPGAYDVDNSIKALKSAPGVKFGKEQSHNRPSDVPGPGGYNLPSAAFDRRGVKFGHDKKNNLKENYVPGPGQYNVNDSILHPQKGTFKFDKQNRSKNLTDPKPGPGAYDPNLKRSGGFSIPKESRDKNKVQNVPGPGAYESNSNSWDKNFPRFGKSSQQNKQGMPVGPGMYNIPHSIPDVPRYNYPDLDHRKIKI